MAAARARRGHAVAAEVAAREGEAHLVADAARRLAALVVLERREALDGLGGQLEQVVVAVAVGERRPLLVLAVSVIVVEVVVGRVVAPARLALLLLWPRHRRGVVLGVQVGVVDRGRSIPHRPAPALRRLLAVRVPRPLEVVALVDVVEDLDAEVGKAGRRAVRRLSLLVLGAGLRRGVAAGLKA